MRLYLLFLYNQNLFIPSSTGSLHFFFSMKRKPALKEKSEGGPRPLYPLGLAGAPPRRRPCGRLSLPPPPPNRGAFTRNQNPNPADCSNTKRVSCKHLPLSSSRFRYRRATVAACPNTKSSVVLLYFSHHRGKKSNIILFSSFLAIHQHKSPQRTV